MRKTLAQQWGSAGAHKVHSEGKTNTRVATEAFLRKFELQVDPDSVLPVVERMKRAEHAKKAYFAKMAADREYARRKRARVAATT